MMDKKGFKITLTPELSEELFFNALCNGLGYMCSGYGLRFEYNKADYKTAKLKLATRTSDYSEFQAICYEDVLMQILRDGNKLSIVDEEGDEDTVCITLADVHARVQNAPSRHILDMINEHDDAVTADVILQTVFLGEVIYG
jgi:hypothetical protein